MKIVMDLVVNHTSDQVSRSQTREEWRRLIMIACLVQGVKVITGKPKAPVVSLASWKGGLGGEPATTKQLEIGVWSVCQVPPHFLS
jgi:hypothetical protein